MSRARPGPTAARGVARRRSEAVAALPPASLLAAAPCPRLRRDRGSCLPPPRGPGPEEHTPKRAGRPPVCRGPALPPLARGAQRPPPGKAPLGRLPLVTLLRRRAGGVCPSAAPVPGAPGAAPRSLRAVAVPQRERGSAGSRQPLRIHLGLRRERARGHPPHYRGWRLRSGAAGSGAGGRRLCGHGRSPSRGRAKAPEGAPSSLPRLRRGASAGAERGRREAGASHRRRAARPPRAGSAAPRSGPAPGPAGRFSPAPGGGAQGAALGAGAPALLGLCCGAGGAGGDWGRPPARRGVATPPLSGDSPRGKGRAAPGGGNPPRLGYSHPRRRSSSWRWCQPRGGPAGSGRAGRGRPRQSRAGAGAAAAAAAGTARAPGRRRQRSPRPQRRRSGCPGQQPAPSGGGRAPSGGGFPAGGTHAPLRSPPLPGEGRSAGLRGGAAPSSGSLRAT